MIARRVVLAAALFVWLAPTARAADAADIAAARELATAGVVLADAGKCGEAIDKLARAEKLHHAPTILGRLGECQTIVGHLVEGTENLHRVVREPLGPSPPVAFVKAAERAKMVLAVAEPKIAKLTIHVEPETAMVTVDGTPISAAIFGTPRPMDPGAHVLEARADGYGSKLVTVNLGTSEAAAVTLKLERLPEPAETEPAATPPLTPRPPPATPRPLTPPPPSSSSMRTAATVSFVVGGVALVAGAAFGLFALDRKSALDNGCPNKRCPEDLQQTLDAANRWATLSTTALVVSGAAIAAGSVLLLTAPRDPHSTAITPVTVVVGLGVVGVRGEF